MRKNTPKKMSRAKKEALDIYTKTKKNFNAKVKRLEKKGVEQSSIDYRYYFEHSLVDKRKLNKLTAREIKVYIRNLQEFTKKGGEKIVKYNNIYIPVSAKENYKRSLKRYNANNQYLKTMHLNKQRKPPTNIGNFRNYVRYIEKISAPAYKLDRKEQYKINYMTAIKENLGGTKSGKELLRLIKKLDPDTLIKAYYTPGNEDLGINAVYPGDQSQAEENATYILERWSEYLSDQQIL